MNPEFNVMLIDDSDDDNYIHKLVIRKAGFAKHVIVFEYAESALSHLKLEDRDPVDIIFLDINMPRMNGFEFLHAYSKLAPEHRARSLLFMVSTSLNPRDQERARNNEYVTGFIDKPLTVESLQETLHRHTGKN